MRILFVNRNIGVSGGVERYIDALAQMLPAQGCHAGIVHSDEWRPSCFKECFRVPAIWERELVLEKQTMLVLDRTLSLFRPDVVFLHNICNGKAIDYFAARCRTIMFVHDYKTVDPDGKMLLHDPLEPSMFPLSPMCFLRAYTRKSMPRDPRKGFKAYTRAKSSLKALKRLDGVIVASSHMKRVMEINRLNPKKVTVLPYFAGNGPWRAAEGAAGHMLYAGRAAEGKGLDLILDVLGKIEEDFVLDVAGSGPMEDICVKKSRGKGFGDRIVFHGWLESDDLASLYGTCSFLLMPSVWPEPFGISGIEAAISGKPCVAFDVGGIADWLIDGRTGYLVAPYDKKDMASKISGLLKDPRKAREMGGKARERALDKYNPSKHVNRLMDILRWGQ